MQAEKECGVRHRTQKQTMHIYPTDFSKFRWRTGAVKVAQLVRMVTPQAWECEFQSPEPVKSQAWVDLDQGCMIFSKQILLMLYCALFVKQLGLSIWMSMCSMLAYRHTTGKIVYLSCILCLCSAHWFAMSLSVDSYKFWYKQSCQIRAFIFLLRGCMPFIYFSCFITLTRTWNSVLSNWMDGCLCLLLSWLLFCCDKATHRRKSLFGLTGSRGVRVTHGGTCGSEQQTWWQEQEVGSSHLRPREGSRHVTPSLCQSPLPVMSFLPTRLYHLNLPS